MYARDPMLFLMHVLLLIHAMLSVSEHDWSAEAIQKKIFGSKDLRHVLVRSQYARV